MARAAANGKPSAPAVSLVVVAYESGPTLATCLAAVRAQTFTDYEIILVDNASSDHYWIHEQRKRSLCVS